MSTIKTILFDFGNVVAFFDHERAIRRMLPHTDRSAEQLWQLVYEDDLAYRYERGEVTTEVLFALARDRGGMRCTRAEFVDAFCDIFWPNPPMADLIPRLKAAGYRLVLASNTNAAHYERYREQFHDLLAHFDAIVVSHEAGARKPHPRFFEYAHKLTGCDRNECLFVDDLLANVTAAREFGWNAIHYTRFDDLVPELRTAGVRVD
jgi:putative hydrolase of the HAD superfamily